MPLKKIRIKAAASQAAPNGAGIRLDQFLAQTLPAQLGRPISKGKVRKLIVAGAVYLNRTRVRIASKEIKPGAQLEVLIDLQRLDSDGPARDIPFEMSAQSILFEDEFIIAVDKPAGLPTQPTLDEARNNLFAAVKRFLADRQKVPVGQVYLALHHRLDRDTSGVIVFSKSEKANPGLAKVFASREAQKTYHALASLNAKGQRTHTGAERRPEGGSGKWPGKWSVQNYLGRAAGKNQYCSVRAGGDPAHTDFRVLEEFHNAFGPKTYWIEARPHTGRTHQIRVHLSESGLPILGDSTYGGVSQIGKIRIPRMMLHAVSLTFPHPIHQNEIAIHSGVPGDFNQCLKALQKGPSEDT